MLWRSLVAGMIVNLHRDKSGQSGTSRDKTNGRDLSRKTSGDGGSGQAGHTPLRGGVCPLVVPPLVPALADRLDDLSRRVSRLIPSRHDPEAYHAEKSEIVFELRQLARQTSTR